MTYTCAVTFENERVSGPQTVRLEVEAISAGTALRRAFQAAKKQMPGKRWDSLVVLIEKPRAAEQATEAAA